MFRDIFNLFFVLYRKVLNYDVAVGVLVCKLRFGVLFGVGGKLFYILVVYFNMRGFVRF